MSSSSSPPPSTQRGNPKAFLLTILVLGIILWLFTKILG